MELNTEHIGKISGQRKGNPMGEIEKVEGAENESEAKGKK